MTSAPHLRSRCSLPAPDPDSPRSRHPVRTAAVRTTTPGTTPGDRIELRRLLAAADLIDDRATAHLIGDALQTDGALTTWEHLCAPALAATAGPATARAFALTTGIRQALGERLIRLARPGRRPAVMLAAAPGETGDLPLTALAVVLLEHGVESWRLGADVPWAALSTALTRATPAQLALWHRGHPPAAALSTLTTRHPTVAIVTAGPTTPLSDVASRCLTSLNPHRAD